MTIDNLLSCQVITAEGNVLTASASENADLFWALRGGGGNFGIVTSLEFQGRPVHTVVGGLIIYPSAAAFDVLRNFRDFVQSAPDEVTTYAGMLYLPDGTPAVGVIPCYCGDPKGAERVLEPLRTFGRPVADTVAPMPFPIMQSLFTPSFPDGNHNYWKSNLLRDLPDDAIAACVGARMTSPLSMLILEYYGGAAARVPNDATAFPHRDLPWDIIAGAQWTDPAETPIHRAWARDTEQAVRPFASGAHLLAALDAEPDHVIDSAFGANLPRLREIKSKYDPGNFFQVNQNIKPAQAVGV
jgi:hypothetical protein